MTVPTYNEAGNIEELLEELLRYKNIEIAVFDDNSPDGTWKIVKKIAEKNKRVHLILRENERGRGSVEITMIKYAMRNDADFMIEMDADLSHDPRYIKDMIERSKICDIVVGSRKVAGGIDARGDFFRYLVTSIDHILIRTILGINLGDPSSGFRCFNRKSLGSLNLDGIASRAIVYTEVLYACAKKNFKICEIPIVFKNRTKGTSKTVAPTQLIHYALEILKMRLFSKA